MTEPVAALDSTETDSLDGSTGKLGGHEEMPVEMVHIRELVLKAYPDVVPELVQGDSVDALLSSVEPAQKAHANILARLNLDPRTPTESSPVDLRFEPAPIDLSRIPTEEKLRRGLRERDAGNAN